MVRHYRSRNPLDPGSKLDPMKTLGILHYLCIGQLGSWIAKKEGVSKNTVSSLSAKLRNKLRSSAIIRQAFFEPQYEFGSLTKESYRHFLDAPNLPREFYETVAECALSCPAQYSMKAADAPRQSVRAGDRILNRRQVESYLRDFMGQQVMDMRPRCSTCRFKQSGLVRPQSFGQRYGTYLRERKLGHRDVEDHYLLFAISRMLHLSVMTMIGFGQKPNEVLLPDQSEWPTLAERYVEVMNSNAADLLTHVSRYLVDDPL